ncbi:hypothetical protein GCM10017559_21380 [Streptosporangium longisporum]|uniref:Uncharacterized protein n=1 Tax=Streptosporangium longisporum TaxID=46187 RepID=A0ABP6KFK8_9ACTN
MISRRSPTGTGHPGRHEYLSRSRVTRETFAENSGGPVGAGDAVADGPAVGVAAVGVAPVGSGTATPVADGFTEGDAAGAEVAGEAAGEAATPHAATVRQPVTVASAARVRIANLEPGTCRPPRKTDKSDKKPL